MSFYLVDVDYEMSEDHNSYFYSYEEAVAYAKNQKGRYCGIYKLVAKKR